MTKKPIRIGVLASVGSSYGLPARTMVDGVRIAIEQVNADSSLSIQLEPVFVDPGGNDHRYATMAAELIGSGIRQIVGCYTSSSRKEVLPLVEGGAALLWYPMHYEGFETANNVVYTGAAPNHCIVPLISYFLGEGSRRAFCVGSNYVWAWENNRILAETLREHDGDVVGERLLAVGETGASIDLAINDILTSDADFVFNTLIGESAYAFFRRFRAACSSAGINQPTRFPVASCTLNEPELVEIGAAACDGHISSSLYFSSLQSEQNSRFVESFRRAGIADTQVCSDAETTYVAVRLLAAAVDTAGTDDPAAVLAALARQELDAPQGKVRVDPQNLHIHATPRIARSRKDFSFDILREAAADEAPDPYLLKVTPRREVLSSSDAKSAL